MFGGSVVITILLLGLSTTAQAATNLIPNPGLEAAGAGGTPANWAKTYWGSPIPTFSYPVAGKTGSGASIALNRSSNGDARWTHDPVTVEAGAVYDYTSWYKSNAATAINVQYIKANNTVSWGFVKSLPSSGGVWKQVTATITVPNDVTKIVVFHLIKKKGNLTIDDMSLIKQGGEPSPPPPAEPTLTFSGSPTSVISGQSVALSWNSTNATSCTASGAWSGAKTLLGSETLSPVANATYTLSCGGTGGSVSKQVSITVAATPPPPSGDAFSEGMVTISFDDAWRSQYTNGLSALANAGIKATFYILTEPVKGGWTDYMTAAQVQALAQAGHNIEGHTVSHADLTTLSNTKIDAEIKNSKTYIEGLIGTSIASLAYPFGSYNTKVIDRTKTAGYGNARTADPTLPFGFNTPKTPRYEINSFSPTTGVSVADMKAAIDTAKAQKKWFVFSFHEIENGNSDEYATTIARYTEIIDYIKTSGIKVVTMKEGAALLSN